MRKGEGTMLDDTGNEIFQGVWVNDKPTEKAVVPLTLKTPETFIDLK